MSKDKVNNDNFVIIIAVIFILLILSLINITNIFFFNKVLGAKTKEDSSSNEFWTEFLDKNPNYIPGLIEVGNTEKAKQINSNYKN